jgi:hypothetical protein
MKKKDAQKGKGVSRDAQELFDFISRTYVSPFPLSFPPLYALPSPIPFIWPALPQYWPYHPSLPTRWADAQIIVNDAVLIQPPYTLDAIRAPAGKEQSQAHVRKVVEHFYQRRKTAGAPAATKKGG